MAKAKEFVMMSALEIAAAEIKSGLVNEQDVKTMLMDLQDSKH